MGSSCNLSWRRSKRSSQPTNEPPENISAPLTRHGARHQHAGTALWNIGRKKTYLRVLRNPGVKQDLEVVFRFVLEVNEPELKHHKATLHGVPSDTFPRRRVHLSERD